MRRNGLEQAISRGVAYAPYADLVWCETGTPDLEFARAFCGRRAQGVPQPAVGLQLLPLPSTGRKTWTMRPSAKFQRELSAMGYKYQFITLAGIHSMWYNMFDLAYDYAGEEGMKHYVEKVQEPEFASADRGYTFVSHQQEVGAGYFDDVTTVIPGRTVLGNCADRIH